MKKILFICSMLVFSGYVEKETQTVGRMGKFFAHAVLKKSVSIRVKIFLSFLFKNPVQSC